MPSKFLHKRSNVKGKQPGSGDLETGELAINFPDKKLYTKDPLGNIISLGGTTARGPITLFDRAKSYGKDDLVIYADEIYRCVTPQANQNWNPVNFESIELMPKPPAGVSQSITAADPADTPLAILSAASQSADVFVVDTNAFVVSATGALKSASLSGTGTRMVTADSTGKLGDAPDPTGLIAVRKHDATATYAADAMVQHQDGIWRAKAPVAAEAWNPANWTRIDTDGAVTTQPDGTVAVIGSLTNVNAALNQLIAKQLYIEKDPVASQSIVNGGAVSDVPLTIQGKAGQTGNLQQWSDSAGAVTAEISSSGFNLYSSTFMPEAHITMESANSGGWGQPFLLAKRARGTMAAKEAVKNKEALFQLRTMGYKGDAYSGECGRMSIYAGEDFTPTSCETYFELQLTKSGKTSIDEGNALIYTSMGHLGIGKGFSGIYRPTHSLDVRGDAYIKSVSATKPVLKVLGATGQTADLIQAGTRFKVQADGKVGIGTPTPSADLHIASKGSATLKLEADTGNVNESDNPSISLVQDGGGTHARINLTDEVGAANNNLEIFHEMAASIKLGTGNKERVRISAAGYVGINNAKPAKQFCVTSGTSSFEFSPSENRIMNYDRTPAGGSYQPVKMQFRRVDLLTGLGIEKALSLTDKGLAGMGTDIPSAQAHIKSLAAATVGLKIQGAIGQTGDLIQAGNFIINKDGKIKLPAATKTALNNATTAADIKAVLQQIFV